MLMSPEFEKEFIIVNDYIKTHKNLNNVLPECLLNFLNYLCVEEAILGGQDRKQRCSLGEQQRFFKYENTNDDANKEIDMSYKSTIV